MKLKSLIAPVAVGLLVAGAAVALETGGRPWTTIAATDVAVLHKVCDAGRAVYFSDGSGGYNRGVNAIAVVDNAPECAFGRR